MMRRTLAFALFCLFLTAGAAFAAAPNDQGWSQQWHLRTIHADRAWARSRGAGVVVAVVDTGVDSTHPDLRGRLVAGRNFVDAADADAGDTDTADRQGHGTFMAGLIAADTGNGTGVASVAPLAKIMPIRVLDGTGTGKPSVVAHGIDYAVAHGAKVINLSLAQEAIGGSGNGASNIFGDPSMDKAINDAAANGAVVVAASGNNFVAGGSARTAYDATREGVLVVGASTRADKRAAYSDYGAGLDLLAPGGGSPTDPSNAACQRNSPVVSTWWNPKTKTWGYGAGCGTSMAVAHVSGIAALLMARGYSNTAATSRIEHTAADLYAPGRDDRSGWGRADAALALGVPLTSAPAKRVPAKPPAVGAAGTPKPVVKSSLNPAASPRPTSKGLALPPATLRPARDTRLRLGSLAFALAVAVTFANIVARRSARANAGS